MNETVICIENLSKRYQLGTIGYESFRHDFQAWWAKVRGKEDPNSRIGEKSRLDLHGDFWALRNVSFEIKRGDRLGIIGRNGAGKSTLLKILSQITRPTSGTVKIKGRVASLLEVGTGFHPELTGRENVFLNGAIMGMKRREIQKKFDEIVDFSGVEKFIDTPVKRYSSGMYVRLAFAVAAHLEPDILVVDEVLAVGDAEFQKKCIGKMENASLNDGTTVIFVSHNLAMLRKLCETGAHLESGALVSIGPFETAIRSYTSNKDRTEKSLSLRESHRTGTGSIRFTSYKLLDENQQACSSFFSGRRASIVIHYENTNGLDLAGFVVSLGIDNSNGERITVISSAFTDSVKRIVPKDNNTVIITIPKVPLPVGSYAFTIFAQIEGEIADWIINAGTFDVNVGDYYGTGRQLPSGQGVFHLDFEISTTSLLLLNNPR